MKKKGDDAVNKTNKTATLEDVKPEDVTKTQVCYLL